MSSDRLELFFILSFPPTNLNSLKRTCQGPIRNQAPTWQRIIYPKSERKVNGFEDIRMVLSPRRRSPAQAPKRRNYPQCHPSILSVLATGRVSNVPPRPITCPLQAPVSPPGMRPRGPGRRPNGPISPELALCSYRHRGAGTQSKSSGRQLFSDLRKTRIAAPGVRHQIWRSLLHFWVARALSKAIRHIARYFKLHAPHI
jgi:hypothetical protein